MERLGLVRHPSRIMGALLELLAIRAREYSDEIARLGECQRRGQTFLDTLAEVDRRLALCDESRDELQRYLERHSSSLGGSVPLVTRAV